MDELRGRQLHFNTSSRDQWDGFAEHRRRVSALLQPGETQGKDRLILLGAGNTNDLDLPALLGTYRELHLADIDAEALASGASRQGVADHQSLHLHGGLDVTAMFDAMSSWTPHSEIGQADLTALSDWPAGRVGLTLPGPFDRVASTCLLSQLIDTAAHAMGDRHPRFGPVAEAIRTGHLRLLARLTRPGGRATLITDIVSTRHLPELANVEEQDLPSMLPRLARSRNHIRAIHPFELLSAVRRDPVLADRVSGLEQARPWFWRLHGRRYLVWAMTMQLASSRRF